ncbi:AAA family ATPase [Methanolobus zinderi]|uniref:DNA double-strand break repair Rad50 ATPase n=1 Tax=Methanolobus zinderi TaxID=536044 RepID=A0A7D5ICZ2_9EURY|nr:AAA family ATPase [Methanolobus zinderi]QLC51149.1 AAA family ATPase [Methanolobus zinderi]
MMIKRLKIQNIRSYESLDLSFDEGVTVVSGVNGSGKSSLLEACFTCLFGSKTLDRDFVLSDIIRKGATRASIMLEFEQSGHDYSIEQTFRNDPEKGRASNTSAVLKKDGEIIFDQASRTYEAIRSLLNMDEEAYRNCVYIRQGEIDVLINSKPKDRQKMIDDLLRLGKLEDYRERASSARIGVGRHQRDAQRRIKEVTAEVEGIEDSKPAERLAKLRSRSKELEDSISSLNEKRDRALSLKDETSKRIAGYRELADKRASVLEQIKELGGKKTKAYAQIESLSRDIDSRKETIEKTEAKISEMRSKLSAEDADIEAVISDIEDKERSMRDKLSGINRDKAVIEKEMSVMSSSLDENSKQSELLEKAGKQAEEKMTSTEDEIKKMQKMISDSGEKRSDVLSRIESMSLTLEKLENIEDIFDLVNDQLKNLHGQEREISVKIADLEEKIKKSGELLDKGKCPTCSQDLHGSAIEENTRADSLKVKEFTEKLSELKKKQETLESKLGRVKDARVYRTQVEDLDKEIKSLNERISDHKKLLEEYQTGMEDREKQKKELLTQKSSLEESMKELKTKLSQMQESMLTAQKEHKDLLGLLEIAKEVRKSTLEVEKSVSDMNKMEERITGVREMISLFDGQIAEKKADATELNKQMGDLDIDELESKLKNYEIALKNITTEIGKLTTEREGVTKQAGMVESELKRLDELKKLLDVLGNRAEYLNAVYEDAEGLEAMYMRVRAELRSNNIGLLDSLINEIFAFMYSNNAYSHIRLDHEYNLTVFEKDGTPLEPKLLSGGERAIFNLVLRCAIYRLLSMGMSGEGSGLPPLIMDEPTVFLDRGHVQQLIKLIDMMRDIGVGQILVVSHDESLIDSADNVFTVEKDPISNSSTIYAK